jgi:hypothetical protein
MPLGEVGKLLGAKWKELDEEEKKVSFCSSSSSRIELTRPSRTSNRPPKTRPEQKKLRLHMMFVLFPSFYLLHDIDKDSQSNKKSASGDEEEDEE